jgi:rfaE bifunctional protein nucleotidyltransferase chain/domain
MGQAVTSWTDLKSQLEKIRKGRKVVFTNGVFDLLHVGHIRYLQEARALGDILVIGVNSDESVRVLKGPTRPIQNEGDRAEILAALEAVSFTVLFGEQTPLDLIKAVRPDILVKGGDYKIETIVGASFVMSYGGAVKVLSFVEGKSTTSIVNKTQS